jgi:hypothetical protein
MCFPLGPRRSERPKSDKQKLTASISPENMTALRALASSQGETVSKTLDKILAYHLMTGKKS